MNDEFEETQKLIRLKRYEQPPEGYMDGFLKEFHQRQRAELMQRSSRSLFFERLSTYLSGLGGGRLMFAGGVAAAVALAVVVTLPKPQTAGGMAEQSPGGFPGGLTSPRGTLSPVADEVISSDLRGKVTGAEEETPFLKEMRSRAQTEPHAFEL